MIIFICKIRYLRNKYNQQTIFRISGICIYNCFRVLVVWGITQLWATFNIQEKRGNLKAIRITLFSRPKHRNFPLFRFKL